MGVVSCALIGLSKVMVEKKKIYIHDMYKCIYIHDMNIRLWKVPRLLTVKKTRCQVTSKLSYSVSLLPSSAASG